MPRRPVAFAALLLAMYMATYPDERGDLVVFLIILLVLYLLTGDDR